MTSFRKADSELFRLEKGDEVDGNTFLLMVILMMVLLFVLISFAPLIVF